VTLSGLAGGEYLPLPVSKGPAFPFLLTLDGYPTSPADFAQGQRRSPRKSIIPFIIKILHRYNVLNPGNSRRFFSRARILSDYDDGS
jgi:hypothetical protein